MTAAGYILVFGFLGFFGFIHIAIDELKKRPKNYANISNLNRWVTYIRVDKHKLEHWSWVRFEDLPLDAKKLRGNIFIGETEVSKNWNNFKKNTTKQIASN